MNFWFLFLFPLVISSHGFYRFVYFISTGYAFSVLGLSVGLLVAYGAQAGLPAVLALVLLGLYGGRLGVFLVLRELRNGSYRRVLDEQVGSYKKMPFFVQVAIWLAVSTLYVMQVSPLYFRLANAAAAADGATGGMATAYPVWLWAGTAIIALGLGIQALADYQKEKAKRKAPDAFCRTGLFKMVRCPAYFGEILVWTGVYLSSVPCLSGPAQMIFSTLGYIGIVFVMFGSTRRLELRQNARYGADPAYKEYVKNTPVLLPLIPLHSVARWKWLGA
jgi:steroid 5-alpha reductase family enzyme